MFPYGAVISACSMMRRNNEKAAKSRSDKSVLTKKTLPTSKITLRINKENTGMEFDIEDESDWARAAWVLINVCKQKGQMDNLNYMLENCEPSIRSGSLDQNGGKNEN